MEVGAQVGVIDEDLLPELPPLPGLVLPLFPADLGRELVEELVQEGERDADGVLLVGDDDAGEGIGRAVVRVRGVVVLLDGLPLPGLRPLGDCPREEAEELADAVDPGTQWVSSRCSRMFVCTSPVDPSASCVQLGPYRAVPPRRSVRMSVRVSGVSAAADPRPCPRSAP